MLAPEGNLVWLDELVTDLVSFDAKPGPVRVELAWTTDSEDVIDSFVLESGPTLAGPFATLAEVPPVGPSTYLVTDEPLTEDVPVHYRLSQRLSTGAVELLATADATPFTDEFPENVVSVERRWDRR